MKKFFIFLGVLVGIVLIAVLIIGAIEPTDIKVSRSVLIKSQKEIVFDQMVNFKNWVHWSPWYKMDSAKMKITYTGTDGQVGSGYSWTGSEKTGAGSMKNLSVNGTEMNFQVDFTQPDNRTAQGMLSAVDTGGITKATWTFAMHMPYPMNAMCIFMNMDRMLGGDFENGLANMKQYVEANAQSTAAININEVAYTTHTVEGVRQRVSWNAMDKFFMDNAVLLKKSIGDKINGHAMQLFYGWDTATKTGDVMVAFPVTDTTAKLMAGAQYVTIAAGNSYKVVQKGPYTHFPDIHMGIQGYLAQKGQSPSLIFEEYEVSPIETPDSNKWVTNIYYLVK
jgi:hypothetical protein